MPILNPLQAAESCKTPVCKVCKLPGPVLPLIHGFCKPGPRYFVCSADCGLCVGCRATRPERPQPRPCRTDVVNPTKPDHHLIDLLRPSVHPAHLLIPTTRETSQPRKCHRDGNVSRSRGVSRSHRPGLPETRRRAIHSVCRFRDGLVTGFRTIGLDLLTVCWGPYRGDSPQNCGHGLAPS